MTMFLTYDAVQEGKIAFSDHVKIGSRAASTGGSRMGLREGDVVTLGELVRGMAVVSGNDAAVAVSEYVGGSVEAFVARMIAKARELGMVHTHFMTPNGLPAPDQFTTARDLARLSLAYLRHYPETLAIHSMQGYTYRTTTHHNANRLLGKCPGVDGIKTGFVCAAGYNIVATAKRGNVRILAVVLGAPRPGIRAAEATKLIEMGFRRVAPELAVPVTLVARNTEEPAHPTAKRWALARMKRHGTRAVAVRTVVRRNSAGSKSAKVRIADKKADKIKAVEAKAGRKQLALKKIDVLQKSKASKKGATGNKTETASIAPKGRAGMKIAGGKAVSSKTAVKTGSGGANKKNIAQVAGTVKKPVKKATAVESPVKRKAAEKNGKKKKTSHAQNVHSRVV